MSHYFAFEKELLFTERVKHMEQSLAWNQMLYIIIPNI